MSWNIEVAGGTSVKLPTAGKYCDRDIVVTATGAVAAPVVQPLEVTENGTYTAPAGVDGYSPITVNVDASGGGVCAPATIVGKNLHDIATDIQNTYIQGEKIIGYNGWTLTDYIRVEEGKYYLVYSNAAISGAYCSQFDANKGSGKALAAGVVNCTSKSLPLFVKGHNGYFRFSAVKSQIAALEIYEVANFAWDI